MLQNDSRYYRRMNCLHELKAIGELSTHTNNFFYIVDRNKKFSIEYLILKICINLHLPRHPISLQWILVLEVIFSITDCFYLQQKLGRSVSWLIAVIYVLHIILEVNCIFFQFEIAFHNRRCTILASQIKYVWVFWILYWNQSTNCFVFYQNLFFGHTFLNNQYNLYSNFFFAYRIESSLQTWVKFIIYFWFCYDLIFFSIYFLIFSFDRIFRR